MKHSLLKQLYNAFGFPKKYLFIMFLMFLWGITNQG